MSKQQPGQHYSEQIVAEVTVETPEPHIATITMRNRPRNTLSREGRLALIEALDQVQDDLEVRCVILTGTDGVFTAGAHLGQDQDMTEEDLAGFVGDFDRILGGIEGLRVPVIGAINGPAVGGGFEVALACDIRIACEKTAFIAAGVNVGLIANVWRLVRTVALGPAKEILLTGEAYGADFALRCGLVSEIHPEGGLMDAALTKARRIASRAPLSVEATKQAANLAPELNSAAAQVMRAEQFAKMFKTSDHAEALRAFFEKREGVYSRR